jgi:hypothetical protein
VAARSPRSDNGPYYFAQTFTALEGSAKELSFQLRTYLGPAPKNFHVPITEVATSGQGMHPSRLLFESETLSLPDSLFAPPTTFTVDLGLLDLVADRSYAFVLDSFVVRQQNVFGTAQAIGGLGYDVGSFLSFGAPFAGDRASHFASNWQEFPGGNVDIAFKMTFVVPEPPSIALVASRALIAGRSTLLRRNRPGNSRLGRAAWSRRGPAA